MIRLIILIYVGLLSGCATFSAGDLESLDYHNINTSEDKDKLFFNIEYIEPEQEERYANGGNEELNAPTEEAAEKAKVTLKTSIEEEMKSVFIASQLFSEISNSSKKQGIYFDIKFKHGVVDPDDAGTTGALFGFGLTLIPVFMTTDPNVMTINVYEGEELLKTYEYTERQRIWFHFGLLFVVPFRDFDQGLRNIVNIMASNFINDFNKDRVALSY